jgi:hypothetical protein
MEIILYLIWPSVIIVNPKIARQRAERRGRTIEIIYLKKVLYIYIIN